MRFPGILLVLLALAACANTTPQATQPKSGDWTAYRQQLMRERDQGKLSPMEAQMRAEARFRELYGLDPTMEGAFAYSDALLRSAEAGDLPMAEAETLAQAHQDQALAEREEKIKHDEWLFPPQASD